MYRFCFTPTEKHPQELCLSPDNRWVRQAHLLPWKELQKRYGHLMTDLRSSADDPLRLALCCRLIQTHYRVSTEEMQLMIQESPYLQYFCGYPEYDPQRKAADPLILQRFDTLSDEIFFEITSLCSHHLREERIDTSP